MDETISRFEDDEFEGELSESEKKSAMNEYISHILSLKLPEAYKTVLSGSRFDYMNMKDDLGKYKHHYSQYIS